MEIETPFDTMYFANSPVFWPDIQETIIQSVPAERAATCPSAHLLRINETSPHARQSVEKVIPARLSEDEAD
jgi:hypothetical protein